jgi:amino acid transporter
MASTSSPDPGAAKLPRVLGPTEALCIIVGSVIGSGIFIVPGRVAAQIPAIGAIAFAWILGGIFSLAGALTLAELAAMLPHAGGPYVYLRKAFGDVPAFLFGWTEFLVIRAGSVATLAAAFALYFAQLVPGPGSMRTEVWQMLVAVTVMTTIGVINVLGTKVGSGVQVVGTALKIGALALMMLLPFLLGKASVARLTPVWPAAINGDFVRGLMVGMVGILWAYDGWVNTSSMAEEIRDPGRNVPRSLMQGMAILIAVYLGMSMVYHMVLPMEEVAAAATEKGSPKVVAAVFCQRLLGAPGLVAISLVVMCSTAISVNGNTLSGPRAYFAMARDGLFPEHLCRIHPRFQTPANAIIAQTAWSVALTVLGTIMIVSRPPATDSGIPAQLLAAWKKLHETPLYDVLYSYVIFGGTLIYTLTIASVFALRARNPELPRPYRTWGYPVTPLIYIGAAVYLMISMLMNSSWESLTGLGIILLGLPAYLIFKRRPRAVHTGLS